MNLDIKTSRLLLCPLTVDDIDIAIELFTDSRVTEYLGEVESEQQIKQEISTSIRRSAGGAIGVWSIQDLESREKYGTCCLLPLPINEDDTNWDLVAESQAIDYEIEIGFIIKHDAWGKGIATEAAEELLNFAFESLETEAIVAVIDDNNSRSRRVLLKIGMKEIGMRKAYNCLCPGFSITRKDWLQKMI